MCKIFRLEISVIQLHCIVINDMKPLHSLRDVQGFFYFTLFDRVTVLLTPVELTHTTALTFPHC